MYGMTIHPVTLMGNYLAIRICFICPCSVTDMSICFSVGLTDREKRDLGPIYGFQWRHFGSRLEVSICFTISYDICSIIQSSH